MQYDDKIEELNKKISKEEAVEPYEKFNLKRLLFIGIDPMRLITPKDCCPTDFRPTCLLSCWTMLVCSAPLSFQSSCR